MQIRVSKKKTVYRYDFQQYKFLNYLFFFDFVSKIAQNLIFTDIQNSKYLYELVYLWHIFLLMANEFRFLQFYYLFSS